MKELIGKVGDLSESFIESFKMQYKDEFNSFLIDNFANSQAVKKAIQEYLPQFRAHMEHRIKTEKNHFANNLFTLWSGEKDKAIKNILKDFRKV